MIRRDEPLSVLVAIIIALASVGVFVFVVVVQRLESLQTEIAASNAMPVDVSGWQTYQNSQYGFEFEYPPQWQILTGGLAGATPFITLDNPPSTQNPTSAYTMQIFIENNTSSLASGEYAHMVIAAAKAVDAANSVNGPAPQTAPQFQKTIVLNVGAYPAYELYDVFEFDHNAERIYVAHGNEALRFDFPMAQENLNISLPVANNGVAHEIMDTLVFM